VIAALDLDQRNGTARDALSLVPYLESGALTPRGLSALRGFYEAEGLGRSAAAEEALVALARASPGFVPAYLIRADRLMEAERYAECEQLLRGAVTRFPAEVDLEFHRIRCTILRHGRDSDTGRRAADQARELAAAHPDSEAGHQLVEALARD
jgi:hypothetical protein